MHYRSSQARSTQQGPDRVASRRHGVAARLAAFFDALGRRPVIELPLRTLAAADPNRHRRVRDDADLRIIELGLDTELADARRSIDTWMRRQIGGENVRPYGAQTAATHIAFSVDDLVRIRRGLDDALFAVLLGPELRDDEADELLGGWSDLVPRRR
jgi:hypothetical protein